MMCTSTNTGRSCHDGRGAWSSFRGYNSKLANQVVWPSTCREKRARGVYYEARSLVNRHNLGSNRWSPKEHCTEYLVFVKWHIVWRSVPKLLRLAINLTLYYTPPEGHLNSLNRGQRSLRTCFLWTIWKILCDILFQRNEHHRLVPQIFLLCSCSWRSTSSRCL